MAASYPVVRREGLAALDPGPSSDGVQIGKMKRVRAVLLSAVGRYQSQGESLVAALVAAVRAKGGFRPGDSNYPGPSSVGALRAALRTEGFELDDQGNILPLSLGSLDGRRLSDALRLYVQRARRGADDPPQVIGTVKSLEEAAASHSP